MQRVSVAYMLIVGGMRHRITLERQQTTQDSVGQTVDTWTTLRKVWAKIKPLGAREFYAQSGEHAQITHEVYVRHGVGATAADRISYDGRTFDIRGVINQGERDKYLTLRCVETTNG